MAQNDNIIKRLIDGLGAASDLWTEQGALLRPGELACRAGCFGCCVGLFTISLPEALALRAALAGLAEETRAAVLARAASAVQRSAVSFPGYAAAGILDPERSNAAEDAWLAAVRETACPALDLPSGRCTVYAARPTTCRTYGLALRAHDEVLLPACELNLPSAPPARVLATAIEAARLTLVDQSLLEIAAEAGLPAGVETTVAHALTGTAFPAFGHRRA
jgi:Fe-S-cluster containining protein